MDRRRLCPRPAPEVGHDQGGGIARLGAILVIAGLTVIGAVILTTVPVPVAAVGWIIAGLGAGLGFTINSIAVLDDAAGTVGRASSQMELGNQAGIAIGTGLAGALVATMGATATGPAASSSSLGPASYSLSSPPRGSPKPTHP